MRSIRLFLGLALLGAAGLTGCGGEARDATSKELSALTAEISRLRADQAAMSERLGALERSRPKGGPAEAPASAGAAAKVDSTSAPAASAGASLDSDRPSLDVVRLGPSSDGEDEGDGDIDDAGPRTVVRSGTNGIIVEEQAGPGAPARTVSTTASKKAAPAKKSPDKADRKKTASLPTP